MTKPHDIQPLINPTRLQKLTVQAINEYSPTFAETPAAWVFEQALKAAGLTVSHQPVPVKPGDRRANLVVSIGPQPAELMLVGHIDTIALWHEEGHHARIEGDRLYGLGAADMKGPCAAMVEALIAVSASGIPLQHGVTLALVVGEEEYGDGSAALVKKHVAKHVIIGEPTRLKLCPAHYGYLECLLNCTGKRAHAALPEVGANAIESMLDWMAEIFVERKKLPYSQDLAINPRQIRGGEADFVVAENCESLLDFHLPPGIDKSPMIDIIETTCQRVKTAHPEVDFQHAVHFWSQGYALPADLPVLGLLQKAFQKTEIPWRISAFRSHSDARLFLDAGMTPFVCGPGSLSVAHRRDEHIFLEELTAAARLYAAIIHEICISGS